MRILATGDSLIYGFLVDGDSFARNLVKRYDGNIYAYNGLKSKELVEMIKHIDLSKYDLVILSIGINDLLTNVSELELIKNLDEILKMCQDNKKKLYYLLPYNLDFFETDMLISKSYVNKLQSFLQKIYEIKNDYIEFIDILDIDNNYKNHLLDGIHPSRSLHRKIFEYFLNIME